MFEDLDKQEQEIQQYQPGLTPIGFLPSSRAAYMMHTMIFTSGAITQPSVIIVALMPSDWIKSGCVASPGRKQKGNYRSGQILIKKL
jgi:hypothetical protein